MQVFHGSNTDMKSKIIQIELPSWMQRHLLDARDVYPTREDRMAFVVELSQKNVTHATGGPFAAAIFDGDTGQLLAAGVNMVTTLGQSIAHAEIIAITQAHALLCSFDLGGAGLPRCELVSSTAPCAMCLGAIPWSGVRALVCGARDEDAREAGFDEGSKRDDWIRELEVRGIEVVRDVLRDEAAAVLRDYVRVGGVVYNGRRGE